MIQKFVFVLFVLFLPLKGYSNDGSFTTSGNHLIPILESDVRVQKEVLTLRKNSEGYIEVDVYYEFFNPKGNKSILVGFEAATPSGDVDGRPVNGMHPYIKDFTVKMNDVSLPFKVACYDDTFKIQSDEIVGLSQDKILAYSENENEVGYGYVYYFKANFKKGLNVVKHTYRYKMSNSVYELYSFDYVLSAAKRWGNKQIDDFTLIIEPGEFETLHVGTYLFKDCDDWQLTGKGKCLNKGSEDSFQYSITFYIQNGSVVFHKKNFIPDYELNVFSEFYVYGQTAHTLTYTQVQGPTNIEANSELERRVIRNWPFARRGYVFKDEDLNAFYRAFDWYMPDPNYVATMESLSEEEKQWVLLWK